MSVFDSANAYSDFANLIRGERRWIMDTKGDRFLSAVRRTADDRVREISLGHRFFRAQRGTDLELRDDGGEWEHPLQERRMIPDVKYIKEGGRANPPGFAYLYLATDEQTALAEMRPWIGESLTLALFETIRPTRLVICGTRPEDLLRRYCGNRHSAKEIEGYVWNDIGQAFAQPANRDDQQSSYIPTQILAEVFKAAGFDGIAYQSGLGGGANIVLFDPKAAKPVRRFAYTLKRVRYDFEAVPNYAISRQVKGSSYVTTDIFTDSRKSKKPRRRKTPSTRKRS